jgi:hypothetical protein
MKYAFADVAAAQTDSPIVAAVAGFKIRVHQILINCGATATTARFKSKPGGGGSNISPLFQPAANGGFTAPESDAGWFETVSGQGLAVDTGAGSATGIMVGYTLVA